jgi:hypothetical protein
LAALPFNPKAEKTSELLSPDVFLKNGRCLAAVKKKVATKDFFGRDFLNAYDFNDRGAFTATAGLKATPFFRGRVSFTRPRGLKGFVRFGDPLFLAKKIAV